MPDHRRETEGDGASADGGPPTNSNGLDASAGQAFGATSARPSRRRRRAPDYATTALPPRASSLTRGKPVRGNRPMPDGSHPRRRLGRLTVRPGTAGSSDGPGPVPPQERGLPGPLVGRSATCRGVTPTPRPCCPCSSRPAASTRQSRGEPPSSISAPGSRWQSHSPGSTCVVDRSSPREPCTPVTTAR
jgi:hypothetical protein